MRQINQNQWRIEERFNSWFVLTKSFMGNLWMKTKSFLLGNKVQDLRPSSRQKAVTRIENGNVTIFFKKNVMP